jgi:hypothetical protein
VGSPGLGKTLMLRIVERRLSDASNDAPGAAAGMPRALYLPYAGVDLQDLAIWVHGLLGQPPPSWLGRGEPPTPGLDAGLEALLGLGRAAGRPFHLLIDDADSMRRETLRVLARELPRRDSPLRLLVALNPDSKGARTLAALHAHAPLEIGLRRRLDVDEVARYLARRLDRPGVPPILRARVDEDLTRRLHSMSGGHPRALHALALAALDDREGPGRATLRAADRGHEDWMGRPIDDDAL